MIDPRVTICLPVYNSEATLDETLKSILGQTYRNILVKIFDNASTDRTVDLARSHAIRDQRVQIFSHAQNIGAEGNFTRCLEAADGEFTVIFHADDIYEKDMVAKQVAFLLAHPECAAVSTHASFIDDKGRPRGERFLPPEIKSLGSMGAEFRFADLLRMVVKYGNFITCPSVMARSALYRDEIRTWNGTQFKSSADLDVWLRLAMHGRFGLLTEPLMRYRISNASFTVREVKTRTQEHDIFKVLRHYVTGQGGTGDAVKGALSLSSRDLAYLRFQEFKDIAARRWNILRSKADSNGNSAVPMPTWTGSWIELLQTGLSTAYHRKYLVLALGIFVVTGLASVMGIKSAEHAQ